MRNLLRIEHEDGIAYIPPTEIILLERNKEGVRIFLRTGKELDYDKVKEDVIKNFDEALGTWQSTLEDAVSEYLPKIMAKFDEAENRYKCPECEGSFNGSKCDLCGYEHKPEPPTE